MTSISDARDEMLRLTDGQRHFIACELLERKKEFGDFLCLSKSTISMFEPEHIKSQTPATCPTSRFVPSFYADGSLMQQCIFSHLGHCNTCGCVVTPLLANLVKLHPDVETARVVMKMVSV